MVVVFFLGRGGLEDEGQDVPVVGAVFAGGGVGVGEDDFGGLVGGGHCGLSCLWCLLAAWLMMGDGRVGYVSEWCCGTHRGMLW